MGIIGYDNYENEIARNNGQFFCKELEGKMGKI